MTRARVVAEELPHTSTEGLPMIPAHLVDRFLELLRPLVEAIGATVGPHCEAVLHDLRQPEQSIVAISNGTVTKRKVGGPLIGGPTKDIALKLLDSSIKTSTLSLAYKTVTRDGRELRSTSLVLHTTQGRPVIAVCLNVDLSTLHMARALLEEISSGPTLSAKQSAEPAAQIDVADVISQIMQESFTEVGKPPQYMERDDRIHAIKLMHERGLFLIRGGVERVAAALGISRFTLYSYLKEVRV